ncbi:DUF1684 domain-containing protein [Deinococcus peraridilitoris]|uniref:DUF1684 domain-containing protein n=1 Tax=Deinococcus peraridilitoris (strain DSM 19664 / LMG 22246 / CIP 109416 / KR-200) TaxID=937777 RepID=L0A892_DEIPD|nr:DUF1684 domain-containing protein [Deinococcus peraridilitoris]AFZ69290.1 Protein of unknown function (DUF1684) [Deinococcus peraridilitoris DSM 19664]
MDDVAEILKYRQQKDDLFRTRSSPIPQDARASFEGLSYYPPDPAYRVVAPLKRAAGESAVITTSTGETQEFRLYGTARVTLPAGEAELNLYAHPDDKTPVRLFVPFRDATSGPETYGAGRYLEAAVQGNGVILDFNLAYDPYCAYADTWSCPLPPSENWLPFPVRAGEKNPK